MTPESKHVLLLALTSPARPSTHISGLWQKTATLGNKLLVVNWHDHVKDEIITKCNRVKVTGTYERTQLFDQVCQITTNHLLFSVG